uniref:Uncharacterized protein n=1 Tax=Anopheles funestus TaxID=62324 RepID=A0A182RXX6_ANOFN
MDVSNEEKWRVPETCKSGLGSDSEYAGVSNAEPASLDFIFEDEEDCYDDTDCVVIEDDWHEDASKDEDVRIDADNAPESNEYAKRLRIWALSHNITHTALSALLVLTQETTNISLPKCAKTFLRTPIQVDKQIATVAGG